MKKNVREYKGLTNEEVINSRNLYGINELEKVKKESFLIKFIKIFKEPMFSLLLIASLVYFLVGELADGIIMFLSIFVVVTIEFIEEERNSKALEELNKLSSMDVEVIRNGKEIVIDSKQLVVNDILILDEGDCVPADGIILECFSFATDESSLTGESAAVYKTTKEDLNNHFKTNMVYSGTNVTSGYAIVQVTAVGKTTEFGKIGNNIKNIKKEKSLLQYHVNRLVLICAIISFIGCMSVMIINFVNLSSSPFKERFIESLLSGITVAMATIPEEIPVILSVFLAMGAWSLSKKNTLTKNMKAIETLGSITVLCTDKTGTLTENKMVVAQTYEYDNQFNINAYLSCSSMAYDPMEIAIKKYIQSKSDINEEKYKIMHEYIFTTENKMVGNVWQFGKKKILCIKGGYENILPMCNLEKEEQEKIVSKINEYASAGYRVLAVAGNDNITTIEKNITKNKVSFKGLIAIYDPPRRGIPDSLNKCYKAGIRTIMITGDNGLTALGIANKINLINNGEVLTGQEIEKLSDEELKEKVKNVNIYARVYPDHKMRIVSALQANNEIVAMTGDGVNDAPALTKANIGIAMGQRGTSVAKESADIVLLDDNFNTIVSAIENGRGIYSNIRKAITYILAIHIPIILLSVIVPLLKLPTLLLPIHIVLMEFLMDPTSSIAFQRIKSDKDIMEKKPRNPQENIINKKTAIRVVAQGLWIFVVTMFNYVYLLKLYSVKFASTVTYAILLLSLILISFQLYSSKLTIVNIYNSIKDKIVLSINLLIFSCLISIIYIPYISNIAGAMPLNLNGWLMVICAVIVAVIPFDLFKFNK